MAQGKYSVSPKGQLKWAYLFTPDTKFKSEGQFHTKLEVPLEQGTPLKEEIDRVHKAWLNDLYAQQGKKNFREFLPYQVTQDEEGLDTSVVFHFKMKASGVNKKTGSTFTQRPFVVGPDKAAFPPNTSLGNGSGAKVAYEMFPYEYGSTVGVQLRLRGVQVLQIVEYNGSENGEGVFSVEEGYTSITPETNDEDDKEISETLEEETGAFKKGTDNGDF